MPAVVPAPPAATARAARAIGGTAIVAISTAEATYVAASIQKASGSAEPTNATNSPATG
jgi:hypothetical protein